MSVAIVMPAWNEASGIGEFLHEIHESFTGTEHTFIVVDDCSTDQTVAVLNRLRDEGLPILVHRNAVNSGHGPSTVRALRLGLETGAAYVIGLDGDGQFYGKDVYDCYREIESSGAEIIEGIRTRQKDPAYRKATSFATRVLVWSRCRQFPTDANTPLRVYRSEILRVILPKIPAGSLVPNLMISAFVRTQGMNLGFVQVDFIDRRGVNPESTTWGRSKSYLPSKRFLKFCTQATKNWLEFNPR